MTIKELKSIYFLETHKKYNIIPTCKKHNVEIIITNEKLKNKIRQKTNMPDYELSTYQNYESYEVFLQKLLIGLISFPIVNKKY